MLKKNIDNIKNSIEKLKKTKEVIEFAYQLSYSIESGLIKSENIQSELIVATGKEEWVINRDWRKFEDALTNDFAIIIRINIVSFQIIVAKESYASLFVSEELRWATENEKPDLFGAQSIFKCIRDALGHFKAPMQDLYASGSWNFRDKKGRQQYPNKLHIKSLGIYLDTVELQDKRFDWEHIGGIANFIKILDYLIADLVLRI